MSVLALDRPYVFFRGSGPTHEALLQRPMHTVRVMHHEGIRIKAGTDPPNPLIVPGASLHEELGLLVRAGLGPEEAWAAATTTAGASLREPGLGTLREGAPRQTF
jgi:imidazolonepropionase-like amidohydrolase